MFFNYNIKCFPQFKKFIFIICVFYTFSFFILSSSEIYFSPEDKIADKLITMLDAATSKIHLAVFVFTYKKLAEAMVRAKNRGLDVQVIIDEACMKNFNNKIFMLKDANIDLFIFKSGGVRFAPKMHNKFVIFDDKFVSTGSFNWTWSASKINEENIVILSDTEDVKSYESRFELLKKRCMKIKGPLKKESKIAIEYDNTKYYNNLKQKIVDLLNNIKRIIPGY